MVSKAKDYQLRFYDVYPVVEMEYEQRQEGYAALGSFIDGDNAEVCDTHTHTHARRHKKTKSHTHKDGYTQTHTSQQARQHARKERMACTCVHMHGSMYVYRYV